ncbi:MAG: hypothetical protein CMM84_03770 [Rhodothermaceae bacterium]|mgnify:CR=1 FL=1|nr:hypothetical protein [Rhodothermaceae bacterium]MBC15335.1 hypothetical protein [Rhodothermaceae bacterium]
MRQRWTGLGEFRAFLEGVERRARSPAPLLRRVAEAGRSSTVRRIQAGDFEANAPATVAAKGSSSPLVDTGRYVQSISVAYGASFAAWGSNDKRARLLHDGGTVTPKRATFLAFPPDRAARRLVRRFGGRSDGANRAAVKQMRTSGYRVWTVVRPDGSAGAVLYARGRGEPKVLLVLKKSVTVPARPHYFLDDGDEATISHMAAEWIGGELL